MTSAGLGPGPVFDGLPPSAFALCCLSFRLKLFVLGRHTEETQDRFLSSPALTISNLSCVDEVSLGD